MCPHISILYDFDKEAIFSFGNDGVESDEDSDDDILLMEFDPCIPFRLELFPHHGDSISQVLSIALPASKETDQDQVSGLDETKPSATKGS